MAAVAETIEEFVKRGGRIKKCITEEYTPSRNSRYKRKDLDMGKIIQGEKQRYLNGKKESKWQK